MMAGQADEFSRVPAGEDCRVVGNAERAVTVDEEIPIGPSCTAGITR